MILKASQRGGGRDLAVHLLKPENEHVEVHEVRGFCSETVLGAFKEAQAVARGTSCQQYISSPSPSTRRKLHPCLSTPSSGRSTESRISWA